MTEFFEIDFVEAGEKGSGDAIALRYHDDGGQDYIHVVDGGYQDDGDKLVKHIREYYGDPTSVNNVILTHPDGDHAAGLHKVLEEIKVGTLWMNRPWLHVEELLPRFSYPYTKEGLIRRLKKDYQNIAELEELAKEKDVEIKPAFQGEHIGEFTVLSPNFNQYIDLIVDSDKTPEPERQAAIKGEVFQRVVAIIKRIKASWGEENLKGDTDGTSCENETSIVQFAELCGVKILLTGDAGVEALSEAYDYALELGIALPGIDRLHVPHHGSRRNVSSEVLDKWLGPQLPQQAEPALFTAIVSANQNDEEHPKKAVVRALIHRGAKVVQTDGTIRTQKNAPERKNWSAVTPLEYPTDMEE